MTLFDEFEMVSRHAGMSREELQQKFDFYFHAPKEKEAYVFKGPDWMIMGHRVNKGEVFGNLEAPDDYWFIFYASNHSNTLAHFVRLVPYELPFIGFCRPLKNKFDITLYPWQRIKKLCESRRS